MDDTKQNDADIQIIPEDTDSLQEPKANLNPSDSILFYEMAILLAEIGKELADTYSDRNQETGAGFVESLRNLASVEEKLESVSQTALTIAQKAGLQELIEYLRGKLERRASSMDNNVVNM